MKHLSVKYIHNGVELLGEMYNENEKFNLELSNIKFSAYHMDGFKTIDTQELDERFELDVHGDLTNFSLFFSVPLLFKIDTAVESKFLECELIVEKDKDNYSVSFLRCKLNLNGTEINIPEAGNIEGALQFINKKITNSIIPLNCYSCKFSDYSIYGQQFWASLLCFKNLKKEYLSIKNKDDYMEIMDDFDRMVPENYFCVDFEERPENHGYRG